MTEEKRTLIETFLPIDEISEEAKLEKLGNAKPPMSSLHYWWTRKPLITARTAVLGALLPGGFDQQEFKKLLGIIHVKDTGKRAHLFDIPLDRVEQLKKEYCAFWGELPDVLDPFAGGGSIPFEIMRVGVDATVNDYNPVAHLIEKATLEYPRKYGEQLYKDVETGLDWVFNETKKEMTQFYPKRDGKDVAAYIWAWSVKCPNCGFDSPLVGQWWLVNNDKKKIFIEPKVEGQKLSLKIKTGSNSFNGTASRGIGTCLNPECGATINNEIIKNDIQTRDNDRLLVDILNERVGKSYVVSDENDFIAFNSAKKEINEKWSEFLKKDLIPLEEMPDDLRGAIWAKLYLTHWHRLLNARQKLLFVTIVRKINEYSDIIHKKHDSEYCNAIVTYLAFVLGKEIDYNSRSTSWHRRNQQISHALAAKGIAMSWDHAEVNPFVIGSGSILAINKSILDGLRYSLNRLSGRGSCKITNKSISQLEGKYRVIVCDPPYYDDVQYAELSELFYVWERKALVKNFDLGDVPKMEDMSVGGHRDKQVFKKLFKLTCNKFNDLLYEDGILVMFFAHSSIEAWDFVINSLQKTGFRITATWPIHTENSESALARDNASIMSSIIIVARKRKSDKSGYIEEIQDEVKSHLLKRLDEFWNYGLRGADLTVSAMGATLDIITQYSDIKSYTGEMQIKDILELVQKYVAQYVLDRYMKNASGLDAATSFYLYTRLSQLEGMPFDTANLIAKSMNVDLKLFEKQGLIETSKKGKAQGIKILNFSTRETNPKQSLIDCVQFVMSTFAKGGYTEVERELATITFSRNEIKDVLEALLSLPTEDPERQVAQKILERMGQSFPKQGQTGLDNF